MSLADEPTPPAVAAVAVPRSGGAFNLLMTAVVALGCGLGGAYLFTRYFGGTALDHHESTTTTTATATARPAGREPRAPTPSEMSDRIDDLKSRLAVLKHQVDDLLKEIRLRVAKKERILVTTLTKRSAEDLTEYYESLGVKVKYLHSDIETLERTEIIRDLRLGVFDVLVGINLLREGLDIPEVSLVGITDADKEGFLRSERSLIQTIGRAARNINGRVFLYGDVITKSMQKAMSETDRRRQIQTEHNILHGITPKTIQKRISEGLGDLFDGNPAVGIGNEIKGGQTLFQKFAHQPDKIGKEIELLRRKMKKASDNLDFEEAARLRDEIKRLQIIELSVRTGDIDKQAQ